MAIDAIVATKRTEVAERMARRPLAGFRAELAPSDRDFSAALRQPHPAFILEVKPASPSEGPLRSVDDLDPVVSAYARHASAVSVLADTRYFGGSLELLARVRARIEQPVLCKDFVLDPYQVYEARRSGADAVLLMLSVLDDATYRACADAAASLRMGVLTETHSEAEMHRAATLGATVIGINSRDLRSLQVSLDVTPRLARLAPAGALLIAESGIRHHGDVQRLRGHVDGFLVGTTIMRAEHPDRVARALVFGATKICGLTREPEAAAAAAGATHGGLVFAPESARAVDTNRAASLAGSADLAWVGVFVNERPERIAACAAAVGLAAVQLHGDETREDVDRVRAALPETCAVWKAVRVRDAIPAWADTGADLVLLDAYAPSQRGGTGRRFDWTLLARLEDRDRYALSGGLNPANVADGARLGLGLIDVSSGVEEAPGRKSPPMIRDFLRARRGRRREANL